MRTSHALLPVAVGLAGLDSVAAKCGPHIASQSSVLPVKSSTSTSVIPVESSTSTCIPPSNPYLVTIPTSIPSITNSDTTSFVVTPSPSETPSTPTTFSNISSTTTSSSEPTETGCPGGTAPQRGRGGTVCVPVERRRSGRSRK